MAPRDLYEKKRKMHEKSLVLSKALLVASVFASNLQMKIPISSGDGNSEEDQHQSA